MDKTLDQIVDAFKPMLVEIASAARIPGYIFIVVDQGIGYFRLEYDKEKSGLIARLLGPKLKIRDLSKERVWKRREYKDRNLANFVYGEASKIVSEVQKEKPPVAESEDKIADIAVICFSDRVYNALNRGAESMDSADSIYKYKVKLYEYDGRRFSFRLYKMDPGTFLQTAKKMSGRYGGIVKYPMVAAEIIGYLKGLVSSLF